MIRLMASMFLAVTVESVAPFKPTSVTHNHHLKSSACGCQSFLTAQDCSFQERGFFSLELKTDAFQKTKLVQEKCICQRSCRIKADEKRAGNSSPAETRLWT